MYYTLKTKNLHNINKTFKISMIYLSIKDTGHHGLDMIYHAQTFIIARKIIYLYN